MTNSNPEENQLLPQLNEENPTLLENTSTAQQDNPHKVADDPELIVSPQPEHLSTEEAPAKDPLQNEKLDKPEENQTEDTRIRPERDESLNESNFLDNRDESVSVPPVSHQTEFPLKVEIPPPETHDFKSNSEEMKSETKQNGEGNHDPPESPRSRKRRLNTEKVRKYRQRKRAKLEAQLIAEGKPVTMKRQYKRRSLEPSKTKNEVDKIDYGLSGNPNLGAVAQVSADVFDDICIIYCGPNLFFQVYL